MNNTHSDTQLDIDATANAKANAKAKQEVVAIAAMADNRVIGIDNRMPWHLPCDLKRFKALTLGCPVVMGRNTFESLGRKPLPGRRNMVVSRTPQTGVAGVGNAGGLAVVETFGSLFAALAACANEPRVFLIGGAQLYAAAFEAGVVTRLELTRVFLTPQGDTFFPAFEQGFERVAEEDVCENGIHCRFERWLPRASV